VIFGAASHFLQIVDVDIENFIAVCQCLLQVSACDAKQGRYRLCHCRVRQPVRITMARGVVKKHRQHQQ